MIYQTIIKYMEMRSFAPNDAVDDVHEKFNIIFNKLAVKYRTILWFEF